MVGGEGEREIGRGYVGMKGVEEGEDVLSCCARSLIVIIYLSSSSHSSTPVTHNLMFTYIVTSTISFYSLFGFF